MAKIVEFSEFKRFAGTNQRWVAKMVMLALNGAENIGRKGENAGYQHFLPHCFQFFFYASTSKD